MILFEDNDIIVCHKQAGIPVQSARIGQKDMVSILNNYLAEKSSTETGIRNRKKEPETVHVVHRLDQPVEGVLVFAKTKKAAAGLSREITEDRMKKVYHAVCCVTEKVCAQQFCQNGSQTETLVDYLVKDSRTNTSFVTEKGKKDAKRAELSYRILDYAERKDKKYLLTEINLKTGRHHQIRVQMAHAGLPLYGDRKYHENWQEFAGTGENVQLALCAVSLTLNHPVTGKNMTFDVRPANPVFEIFEKFPAVRLEGSK